MQHDNDLSETREFLVILHMDISSNETGFVDV